MGCVRKKEIDGSAIPCEGIRPAFPVRMAILLRPHIPDLYPPGEFQIPREAGIYRIGRNRDSEMCVPHPSVSSRHAVIEVDAENKVEVVDCGSSNGTWVNGQRISERCAIGPGDTIRFATLEFSVFPFSDLQEEAGPLSGAEDATRPVAPLGGTMEGEAPRASDEERNKLAAEVAVLAEARDELNGQLKTLAFRLAGKEEEIRGLLAEKEAELAGKDAEIASLRAEGESQMAAKNWEIGEGNKIIAAKDAEIHSLQTASEALSARLEERESEIRRLDRELEDSVRREERLQEQLGESRTEVMARDGQIASLNYELTRRENSLTQLGEEQENLREVYDQSVAAHAALQVELEKRCAELAAAITAKNDAEKRSSDIVDRLLRLSRRLLDDWKDWFSMGEKREPSAESDGSKTDGGEENYAAPEFAFARVEEVADQIRWELDRIEPIWHQFGEGVREELRSRCDRLREEEAALIEETKERRSELGGVKDDLAQFRELIDTEVRRVQGLSRRGTEIEIPERFEAMIIARDHEQEIYRALIERLEVLDHHLNDYRGSRKLRAVVPALEEFRSRLAAILESSHVGVFELPVGTMLTLKHRKEVQIVNRKGWGTRQYTEYPFQPGEVTKVVRPGYRVGEGESAVILRKVEVLVRGVEE